ATSRNINETASIYQMLEGLSYTLDMTLVYPPLVARFPFAANELNRFVRSLREEGIQAPAVQTMESLLSKRHSEDAGISGVTVWLESHAAIHSWTEENFFSFDAYSCKDFDPEKALDYVLGFFDIKSYNGLDIVRTIDAPQQVRVLSHPG
ncbi:MAG: S-adenosylmethionine decarboxylase family protein, partial [Gammaproteobacteria bacterium]